MAERMKLVPGPDHPIAIVRNPACVIVTANGQQLARTGNALTLREASYPPVHYIPRANVDMGSLEPSQTTSWCPYKGEASYFSLPGVPDAAWSYEAPFDAVAAIKGHLAFYPDRVDQIAEDGG